MRNPPQIVRQQLLDQAFNFAEIAHGEQKYSDEPYLNHLKEVVATLQEFGVTDIDVLRAGALHDTVEDTAVTVSILEDKFGERTADIVERVTDKPGKNRAARHAATYPRLAESEEAVQVKLADRICNMRRGTKNDMYCREYPMFKQYLYDECTALVIHRMWGELDRLNTLYQAV